MKKVIIPAVLAAIATFGIIKAIKIYKELPTFDFSPDAPDPWEGYNN